LIDILDLLSRMLSSLLFESNSLFFLNFFVGVRKELYEALPCSSLEIFNDTGFMEPTRSST
jgi:hypothetical protein